MQGYEQDALGEKRNRHVATILVVDDKPTNIKLLFDALKDTGYRTLAAIDGESAVRQAQLGRPDLILMDVMMPGLNGFEACRRLKSIPATRHIPVIFMTALHETADKIKGFQAGGVDFLTKPLVHEEVLARIDAQMNRHRLWADVEIHTGILLEMGSTDTPEAVWGALAPLGEEQRDVAGLGAWVVDSDGLKLVYVSGFEAGHPATWRRDGGDYARIPLTESLIGRSYTEKKQFIALDETEWKPYPSWAKSLALQGYIITPICCHDVCYGVLALFFGAMRIHAPEERRRWQQMIANSLGNALFHARSLEAIRRLSEQLRQENEVLREEVRGAATSDAIIGTSDALRRVLDQVDLVAPTEATVLMLGESGTGKELFAQVIHERSRRSSAPIIRVNCAAIPHELFESEFFGHVKGAFTGALKDRAGRFELADSGTLFLDEVGEIPLELQGKLLRVLQEGTFERIGDEKTRKTDVRLIAATNRDLQQAVADGRFRQDLYYRLSVFPLTLPPLRERREDIPALVRHFAAHVARKMGVAVPEIADNRLACLFDYSWPGNIRELQNEVERAMILSRGGPPAFASPAQGGAQRDQSVSEDGPIVREGDWQNMQHDNMLQALKRTKWRVDGPGGAAELLDVRPTTLRSRMKAMGIERPV
jgi:DNA-binding NtrC family response regulator